MGGGLRAMVCSLGFGGSRGWRPRYRRICCDGETTRRPLSYQRSLALPPLPAVLREGAVGFGHTVRVLALLHRIAAVVRSVGQLARQARGHRRLAAVARGGYQPADRERLRAVGAD